jgi:hypothetical protein
LSTFELQPSGDHSCSVGDSFHLSSVDYFDHGLVPSRTPRALPCACHSHSCVPAPSRFVALKSRHPRRTLQVRTIAKSRQDTAPHPVTPPLLPHRPPALLTQSRPPLPAQCTSLLHAARPSSCIWYTHSSPSAEEPTGPARSRPANARGPTSTSPPRARCSMRWRMRRRRVLSSCVPSLSPYNN